MCTSDLAFDFAEALSFEGETGPYCQYAAVRAANILRKAGEYAPPTADLSVLDADDVWQLLLLASQTVAAAEQSLHASEPALLAKHTFQLAQSFSGFYHKHHILSEEDAAKRVFLLWLTDLVRRQLVLAMSWMGIQAPEVM